MIVLPLLILLVIFFVCNGQKKRIYQLPPGPRRFPILGNILQLGMKPHLVLSKWTESYGKFYTVYLAHKPTIVVNDRILMKKLFGTLASTGRYMPSLLKSITQGLYGVGGSQGSVWLEQKLFCVRAMKEFGIDTGSKLEYSILEQTTILCSQIQREQLEKGEVQLHRKLRVSANKTLWTLITGETNELKLTDVAYTVEHWVECLARSAKSGLLFLPWLKYLFPETSGYNGIMHTTSKLQNYVRESFKNHLATRAKKSVARDMIDAYIDKVADCQDPTSSFYGQIGEQHGFASLMALLIAGGEGIGTSLNWMIFYVAAHPNVQEKIHQEVDEKVGVCRDPSLADNIGMSYINAVIYETFRFTNLVPAGIAHELLEDVTFENYLLPKGLLLLPNVYHVHNDKKIWTDPENFRPERFLKDSGDPKLKDFVIPFLVGKRTCPGDQTTKNVLFLAAAKLFQKFSFQTLPGIPVREYMEPDPNLGVIIKKLGVKVSLRE